MTYNFSHKIIATLQDIRSQINIHELDEINVHGISNTASIVYNNDSRLSDSRTPDIHASSHSSSGSDPITIAQSQVTNLTTDLSSKASLSSPTFTGVPSAPTASAGTNTTQLATTAFVRTEVSNLVDSSPSTLDTLNELAAALGDDANFSTTVTNALSSKAPSASPTFIGTVSLPSTTSIGDVSDTELGYLNGVTSSIQTQLDGKEKVVPLQSSAPSLPSTSDLWVDNTDTAKPVLKVYNGTSWTTVGSSVTADDDQIILASRIFS